MSNNPGCFRVFFLGALIGSVIFGCCGGVIVLVVMNLPKLPRIETDNRQSSQPSAPSQNKKTEKYKDLVVEHINAKKVGNMWRYFFRISNKGKQDFSGKVTIKLLRASGATTCARACPSNWQPPLPKRPPEDDASGKRQAA